jgi:hypothetical protein
MGQEAYWDELGDVMHRHDFVWRMITSHENHMDLVYSNINVVMQYKSCSVFHVS